MESDSRYKFLNIQVIDDFAINTQGIGSGQLLQRFHKVCDYVAPLKCQSWNDNFNPLVKLQNRLGEKLEITTASNNMISSKCSKWAPIF